VEVAAADHQAAARRRDVRGRGAALGEDQGIVRGGVQLHVQDPAQVVQGIPNGAVDLRHAAQRVRILDLVRRAVMRRHQPGIPEEVPHLGGNSDLARVRTGKLVHGRERNVRRQQRLHALRRGHGRGPRQAVGIGEEKRAQRAHQLRPVEERQAFLRLERERLDPGLAQRQEAGHHLPAQLDLAPPDQRKREMRERREVPGRPDAPLGRDHRVDSRLQERQDPVHHQRPAAGVAERERVRPQQQHRADHVPGQRRADAHRVAHEQVLLELAGVGRRDMGARQVAEPGRDPVDHLARRHEALDDRA
jgi:hypothetical protein